MHLPEIKVFNNPVVVLGFPATATSGAEMRDVLKLENKRRPYVKSEC